MNVPTVVFVTACLWLACQTKEQTTAPQLHELQGEWKLVETANEQRPDRGDDCIRMLIQGKQVTMKFAGLTTNQGSFTVGRRMGTNTIDMKFVNGRTVQGIYERHDSTLVICVDEALNGRPGTLAPKGTQWSEKWQQVIP